MNAINEGGNLYEVGWSVKVPLVNRWMVWLKGIKIIEFVKKYHDNNGDYFGRPEYPERPEYYCWRLNKKEERG